MPTRSQEIRALVTRIVDAAREAARLGIPVLSAALDAMSRAAAVAAEEARDGENPTWWDVVVDAFDEDYAKHQLALVSAVKKLGTQCEEGQALLDEMLLEVRNVNGW